MVRQIQNGGKSRSTLCMIILSTFLEFKVIENVRRPTWLICIAAVFFFDYFSENLYRLSYVAVPLGENRSDKAIKLATQQCTFRKRRWWYESVKMLIGVKCWYFHINWTWIIFFVRFCLFFPVWSIKNNELPTRGEKNLKIFSILIHYLK